MAACAGLASTSRPLDHEQPKPFTARIRSGRGSDYERGTDKDKTRNGARGHGGGGGSEMMKKVHINVSTAAGNAG